MENINRLVLLGLAIVLVCCKKIPSDSSAKNVLEHTDSIKKSNVIIDSMAGRSIKLDPGDAVRNYGGSTGAGTKARPNHDTELGLKK